MSAFQRKTRQREVILEELRKLTSHPTAASLYEIVRRRLPKVSLGTVYRNLELLAKAGEIQKLDFSAGEARFDANPQRHDHVRCVECGKVDDIMAAEVDLTERFSGRSSGYEILTYRLEFLGVCSSCRSQRGDARQDAGSQGPSGDHPVGRKTE